ncbi:MAG: substrate-binding domain-containing protein, partial [Mucispirillum sp.]|nr:substrate-binding domain-containing protein [Mucispirillum sp.]
VVAEFPSNTHDDISYPVAIIKDNSNQEVKKLYNFLISDEAKKIYKKYGFEVY